MSNGFHDEHEFWSDRGTYLTTPEFKAYAAAIGEIIDAAGRQGVTTRQIHEALGDDTRRNWTADAIDSLKNIQEIGVLVTRYVRTDGAKMSQTVHDWKNYPDRPGALPTILKQEQLSQ